LAGSRGDSEEKALRGLGEDKLKPIRSFAKFLSGGRGLTCILSAIADYDYLHLFSARQGMSVEFSALL
jgi:hypothetical protein